MSIHALLSRRHVHLPRRLADKLEQNAMDHRAGRLREAKRQCLLRILHSRSGLLPRLRQHEKEQIRRRAFEPASPRKSEDRVAFLFGTLFGLASRVSAPISGPITLDTRP